MKNLNLIAARQKSGKTQKQVAEKIKISIRNYQDYEYNVSIPSVLTALKIAKTLDTTVENLWGNPKET